MDNFISQAEQAVNFRQTPKDFSGSIFNTAGSSGANSKKLAQIITVLDNVFSILGWDDVAITTILAANQASIDGRYHKDYKDIAIAEEKRKDTTPSININQ